jgi:hypothetical protein
MVTAPRAKLGMKPGGESSRTPSSSASASANNARVDRLAVFNAATRAH